MTGIELLDKLGPVDIPDLAVKSVDETKEELLALNKEQLLKGKLSTGQDITPSYLDDPYFKSRESAQRYSDWKDKITPNPERRSGTPNLYITGQFHESIRLEIFGKDLVFDSSFSEANNIEAKFSENIYGLNEESLAEYAPVALKMFQEKFTEQTGLKFTP